MIDWLKIRAPLRVSGKIPGDTIALFSQDGEVKWSKRKPSPMRGSHESDIQVSECPVTGLLVIDGNPAKFFQGHNVFGSDDVHGLVHRMLWHVVDALRLEVTDEAREDIAADRIEIAKVDITEMYATGSMAHARAAVRAISEFATMKHRGRGLMKEGTVYFGKHSRRSAVKFYAKGPELLEHKLPEGLHLADEIHAFAADKLRGELVLRTMELKELGLTWLNKWNADTGATLHREYIGRVNLPENIELPPEALEGLTPRLHLAYSCWLRGDDLRATLPRKTFYRYRKALLPFGVDLLALRSKSPPSNVFPLRRVIELRPAGVPEWAKGTPAYFEPRRTA